MRKSDLRGLRTLAATPKMMRMAQEDVPKESEYPYWGNAQNRIKYKRGIYMRCQVLGGILKVAFFLPHAMRMGAKLPAYELFINKESGQFLTYDRNRDKWLTAKLDMIQWPAYLYNSGEKWINPEGDRTIKRYLDVDKGGYPGILKYQYKIRADELKRRHKRETDPWDQDLAQTPKLPKDWNQWVAKVGIPENYIFYRYTRKGADSGYCSYCEKDVPIKKPRHNKTGICPCCRHKIMFKAVGKAGTVVTPKSYQYLIQRCKDGFMVREFEGHRKYWKGEYESPEVYVHERRRVIYDNGAKGIRAYYWGDYKQTTFRWITSSLCSPSWYGDASGRVYGKTLPDLAEKELKRTGLIEVIRDLGIIDPERYLAVWEKIPQIEQLAKAKLPFLIRECLSDYYSFKKWFDNSKGSSLKQMLGLNSQELNRLRKCKGGKLFLKWLQYEKAAGKQLPDHVIVWFCKEDIKAEELKFIRDRMSIVQIYNYIRRQMSDSHMSSKKVLTTWKDYLSMAARFKMDTDDAIIYRVRKLRQRHDELVERGRGKGLALRAGEVLRTYPHVESIYEALKDKYEYLDQEYSVLVPECIEDIILEGENLHHCLGSSDRYWDRIERQESYVLFLRRSIDIDKAYYTLEIEPDGTVRQKRTMYDRQEADIEEAAKFLKKWQKVVAKRITETELELAKASRVLREQEFLQMKADCVVIQVGELAGKPLADVLMADLMENQELVSFPALLKSA